mgnify:FL=1
MATPIRRIFWEEWDGNGLPVRDSSVPIYFTYGAVFLKDRPRQIREIVDTLLRDGLIESRFDGMRHAETFAVLHGSVVTYEGELYPSFVSDDSEIPEGVVVEKATWVEINLGN